MTALKEAMQLFVWSSRLELIEKLEEFMKSSNAREPDVDALVAMQHEGLCCLGVRGGINPQDVATACRDTCLSRPCLPQPLFTDPAFDKGFLAAKSASTCATTLSDF